MSTRKYNLEKDKPVEYLWNKLFPNGIPKNFNIHNGHKFINLKEIPKDLGLKSVKIQKGGQISNRPLVLMVTLNYLFHLYFQIPLGQQIPPGLIDITKVNLFMGQIRALGSVRKQNLFRNSLSLSSPHLHRILSALRTPYARVDANGFKEAQEALFKQLTSAEIKQVFVTMVNNDEYKAPLAVGGGDNTKFTNFTDWFDNYTLIPRNDDPYYNYQQHLQQQLQRAQLYIQQTVAARNNALNARNTVRGYVNQSRTALVGVAPGVAAFPIVSIPFANVTASYNAANAGYQAANNAVITLRGDLNNAGVAIDNTGVVTPPTRANLDDILIGTIQNRANAAILGRIAAVAQIPIALAARNAVLAGIPAAIAIINSGGMVGLRSLQEQLHNILVFFGAAVPMASGIEQLTGVQTLLHSILGLFISGDMATLATLRALQARLHGVLVFFGAVPPMASSIEQLTGVQAALHSIFGIFEARPAEASLNNLQSVQREMRVIMLMFTGMSLADARAAVAEPGYGARAVAAITSTLGQLGPLAEAAMSRRRSRYGLPDHRTIHGKEAGSFLNNLELYNSQLDEIQEYLEDYKSTKESFLENVASASSYLVRLILLGSNDEYNKLSNGLTSAPESMVHSFSTVLEREAPIDENHLSSDILAELGKKNKGKKHKDIADPVRNPIESDEEESTSTTPQPSRGGGTIKVFSWNIANDQDTVNVQKKTINKNLNNADILAFQELFESRLIKYRLDFSQYKKFYTKSGRDYLFTFIKKTLKPEPAISGEFETGRPFLINKITIGGKNVLFINVHLGHRQSGMVQTLVDADLNELKTKVRGLTFDRLILVGDFNCSPDFIKLNNIKAKNIVKKGVRSRTNTCCNEFRKPVKANDEAGFIDNVLDSYYKSDSSVYNFKLLWDTEANRTTPVKDLGSDHSPILATLPISLTTAGGGVVFINDYMTYNKPAWKKIGHEFVELNKRRKSKGGYRRKA